MFSSSKFPRQYGLVKHYRVCNTLVSNIIQTVRDYNLIHEDNLLSKKRHSSTDGIIIITYKLHQRIPFYMETIHKK